MRIRNNYKYRCDRYVFEFKFERVDFALFIKLLFNIIDTAANGK